MKLYLLRHGVTEYNAQMRYQGWKDMPLSQAGLAALRPADFSPKTVYITPLIRTRQTAQVLFPQAELIEVPDLKEMCFGTFEGKNYLEMRDDPDYQAWIDSGGLSEIPGGESKDSFCDRICRALADLIDQALCCGEDPLVILAHGGTQMAAMERFALPERPYFQWCGANAGGYVCQVEPNLWLRERKFTLEKTVRYMEDIPC